MSSISKIPAIPDVNAKDPANVQDVLVSIKGILEIMLGRRGSNEDLQVLFISDLKALNALLTGSIGMVLIDTGGDDILTIVLNENLTSDRTLNIKVGNATRTITFSGNPTLADWFDQAVKAASKPTFAGITSTAIVDMGGFRIHDVGDAKHIEDGVNLGDVLNRIGITLNYWLGSSNELTKVLVHSPAFYDQTPAGSQELDDISFTSAAVDTPTPFVIKDNTIIIVDFNAYASVVSGNFTYKLHVELWIADSDGVAESQIGADSNFTDTLTNVDTDQYKLEIVAANEVIVAAGKRLLLRFWATRVAGSGSEPTLYVSYDEVHNHLTIPVSGSVLGRYLHKSGGTMTGDLAMGGSQQVTGLRAPAASGEAIRQTANITEAKLNAMFNTAAVLGTL